MPTEPYDEEEILGGHLVVRRVNPVQHVVNDENTGRVRISSKLYSKSRGPRDGMSVDLPELMKDDDVVPEEFVVTPEFTGAVAFPASVARRVDLMVGYDPIPETNPYHGEVWRKDEGRDFSRSQKRELQSNAEWFVTLPEVALR